MIIGFALTFYKTQLEHNPAFQQGETDKARLEGLRASAERFCQRPEKFLSFE
jgi:hypothetical protein